MEKCLNKGGYSVNHHHYDTIKSKDGKIYINDTGILVYDCIHLSWDELFKYLKENEYKINYND